MKNNGYTGSYDMVMNLAQEMLVGRSLEAFLSEQRSQETKNRVRKAKEQMMHTPNQICYCAIVEKRSFHGKTQSRKVQSKTELNKYLDFILIEKTTGSDKKIKAYGKSLPEDEIRSIMGRAIPPEWTVNLLALGKEPWIFKDLEDQLNMYRQQWQADQQKQIIAKMAGKMPDKTNEGKRKIMIEIIKTQMEDAVVPAKAIPAEEDAEDAEEAMEDAAEEEKIVTI
jgi:hypothetical protein